MSEELNEEPKSKREVLKGKLNKLPHLKQHELNNGWKLYTNAEFSFWDKDPNYLIVDDELDTVFIFYFKEDVIKVEKCSWNTEFTFNM